MTIDEQVREYMDGWVAFIDDVSGHDGCKPRDDVTPTDPVQRGYIDSRAAYLAAEQAERERLERCPTCPRCLGMRVVQLQPEDERYRNSSMVCPACHGTGKRQP